MAEPPRKASPTKASPPKAPTLEDVARLPQPGASAPTSIAFSPDGVSVTYLLAGTEDLDRRLYALNLADGTTAPLLDPRQGVTEENISRAEKLRRERAREMGLGVSSYAWAKDADVLLAPLPDGVYVDGERRIEQPAVDPQLSPNGIHVAFVRDGNLWVDDRQLTHEAEDGLTYGLADFIAQEEMDRYHGFWWSPDSTRIAFQETDERHVPHYRINHVEANDDELHRYPFVGADNAKVRLGIVTLDTADIRWLDLPDFEYLARVDWAPDGSLFVQTTDRRQQRLTLSRFRPSGERETVLKEASDVWVNLHDLFRPLPDGRFLWASERTGFRHLFLYDGEGNVVQQLTDGDWQVDSVEAVDHETGRVWCSGTKDGATERHLYEVSFSGDTHRLTSEPGMHHCTVDAKRGLYVDLHSSVAAQPTATVRRLSDGGVVHPLFARPDPRVEKLGLTPPRLGVFGPHDLNYAVYEPGDGSGPPWPTAVLVYGGPHAQLVTNGWALTANMRAQYLRSRGILVAVCDNRGSARRGLAFEGAIQGRMGEVEVEDQVAFVRHLVDDGLTDPDRIGVYGWSYGGYMSAMLLAKAPGVYRAAVAGAPVTSWDGYDTHYTERYMGPLDENKDGYEASAVFPYVEHIQGALLLVHGLIDENVHFRHTARLVNRLIAARKDYQLLLFPDERHSPRSLGDRVYMEQRVTGFLESHLRG